MKKKLALASLVVAILCCAAEPPADPPSPLYIMLKAAKHTQRISSISYYARWESSSAYFDNQRDEPVEKLTNKGEGRVYLSNGNYYSEYNNNWPVNSPKTSLDAVAAYNGKQHQLLDKNTGNLSLSNAPSPWTPVIGSLLLEPVGFLFAWYDGTRTIFTPMTWTTAQSPAAWKEQAANYKYIETRNEGGLEVVVLEMTHKQLTTPVFTARPMVTAPRPPAVGSKIEITRILFAKEWDWYPIQFTIFSNEGSNSRTTKVTGYRKIPAADGGVTVVPLAVETEFSDLGWSETRRQEILVDTLKVNEPIDDDLFTIPVTGATQILDTDNMMMPGNKMNMPGGGPGSLKSSPLANVGRLIILYIVRAVIALPILLGCGALLWWIIRRRRKATLRTVAPSNGKGENGA
jgi:hypothetical protein